MEMFGKNVEQFFDVNSSNKFPKKLEIFWRKMCENQSGLWPWQMYYTVDEVFSHSAWVCHTVNRLHFHTHTVSRAHFIYVSHVQCFEISLELFMPESGNNFSLKFTKFYGDSRNIAKSSQKMRLQYSNLVISIDIFILTFLNFISNFIPKKSKHI